MSVKSKEEILESIKTLISENDSDESISFLEDITDTLNDYSERLSESEDWKSKYEENDKKWREKYRDRFFNFNNDIDDVEDYTKKEDEVKVKFEDLFKEE